MEIRAYQINKSRDEFGVKYTGFELMKRHTGSFDVDPRIYDEVFRGVVKEKNLEEVFCRFRYERHGLHRGHNLAVSDVLAITGSGREQDGAYYRDFAGWKKIGFDQSLAQREGGLLRIVMLEPGLPAYESYIRDRLPDLQRAVGGFIEITYPYDDDAVFVGNDEAKLIGMEGNRMIAGSLYAGPVFIAGPDGEGFASLTEGQAQYYLKEFSEPEAYTKEEVEDSIYFKFIALN